MLDIHGRTTRVRHAFYVEQSTPESRCEDDAGTIVARAAADTENAFGAMAVSDSALAFRKVASLTSSPSIAERVFNLCDECNRVELRGHDQVNRLLGMGLKRIPLLAGERGSAHD